jgi:hypothetical protein
VKPLPPEWREAVERKLPKRLTRAARQDLLDLIEYEIQQVAHTLVQMIDGNVRRFDRYDGELAAVLGKLEKLLPYASQVLEARGIVGTPTVNLFTSINQLSSHLTKWKQERDLPRPPSLLPDGATAFTLRIWSAYKDHCGSERGFPGFLGALHGNLKADFPDLLLSPANWKKRLQRFHAAWKDRPKSGTEQHQKIPIFVPPSSD